MILGIIPVPYSKSFLIICFRFSSFILSTFLSSPLCAPLNLQSDLRVNGEHHNLSPLWSCCQLLASGIRILSTAKSQRVLCSPPFLPVTFPFISCEFWPFLGNIKYPWCFFIRILGKWIPYDSHFCSLKQYLLYLIEQMYFGVFFFFSLDIHGMDLQPSVWSHSGKEKKISTTGYNEALPYH